MHYGNIKKTDIADGPGVRVSLFVSGCRNHCKGCFNPETWDFCYGKVFDEKAEKELMDALSPSWITGITLLGGDPFEPENEKDLVPLIRRIRKRFPEKTVWCYTGYLYENLKDRPLMKELDVLVDGPFVEALKDIRLVFRGSSNQRILNIGRGAAEPSILNF